MMHRKERQPRVLSRSGNKAPARSGGLWWLTPILITAPLTMAPKGCDSAVVGDDCPAGQVCEVPGTGGKGGGSGGGPTGGTAGGGAQLCGGLLGIGCDEEDYCSFPLDAQCGAADRTGVCEPKPEVCTDIYRPVCGCDDNTYANACEAAGKGVSVASEGECSGTLPGAICGGLTGAGCAKDEYCSFSPEAACGAADQTGVCLSRPEQCTTQYDPVCGCDGKTYGNACTAASAGVSVAAEGECGGGEGRACGGLLGLQCGKSQYCKYSEEAECGAGDRTGVCEPIPSGCDKSLFPVCGCNGKTYGNACLAAAAGTSVASSGECKPTAAVCGGLLGLGCEKGEYCDFPLETRCGSGDQTGTCQAVPGACDLVGSPVCGCDGKTYGNACQAAAASTSVIAEGPCESEPTGDICGGLLGRQCAKNSYCFYEADALCGFADATGICQTRPEACTEQYKPVCGCDGKTYGNSCQAASAGVSVASNGACPE